MIRQIARMALVAAEPERLADFYQSAFGCRRTNVRTLDEADAARVTGQGGATSRIVTIQLGAQQLELVGIWPRGRSYPADVAGYSLLFQHCAIVVADMAAAYNRLRTLSGWSPISTAGPELLPASAGGVTAFKFRDPEGHPLELLAFPADTTPEHWRIRSASGFLGIDHSAISVADTGRSVAFYRQLGFHRTGGSLNVGPAQERLDAIPGVHVEVTALAAATVPTPHLELLCYRGSFDRSDAAPTPRDIAATRLVLAADDGDPGPPPHSAPDSVAFSKLGGVPALVRDPDGHLLSIEPAVEAQPEIQAPA